MSSPTEIGEPVESLKLEHPFLRAPFEHYMRTIRANHRAVEEEVSAVISAVSEAADSHLSQDNAVLLLDSVVSIDRKLEGGIRMEQLLAQRFLSRVGHLESVEVDKFSDWNKLHMQWILVDYMLRMSYYNTAVKLAERANIQDLVDINLFHEAKKIIDALQEKDTSPALAWCVDNKDRMKEMKSKFELQLRLQEFIEILRVEHSKSAISYAQKYLAPWAATHLKELKSVMGTLAFRSPAECSQYKLLHAAITYSFIVQHRRSNNILAPDKYKVLFEPKQWTYLADQFKQEFYRLHGMTLEPLLHIYLQAGLTILKNPFYNDTLNSYCCIGHDVDHYLELMEIIELKWIDYLVSLLAHSERFSDERNCAKEDPLSLEGFRKLAEPLPSPNKHLSKLVCYMSKEVMDAENPPLVLPNGYVYSKKALDYMAKENHGKIICPRTGLVCEYTDAVQAYAL